MPVTLCVPTLTQYKLLHRLILACEAGSLVPDKYSIVDNGGKLILDLPDAIRKKCKVHRPIHNLGVGPSWNWFLRNEEDWIIISNDDIVPEEDAIRLLVNYAQNSDELFFCADDDTNAFSFFLEKKESLDIIGPYDEAFWPAYFEDNDKARRYKLAGYQLQVVPGVRMQEHTGSATLKAYNSERMQKHHEEFRRNQQYYLVKWAGLPGEEEYESPFGI